MTPVPEFSGERQRLARATAWPGEAPWIRRAVDALPRHRFAPDRLWRWDGHRWVPVDRDADPAGWAAEVYGGPYDAAVTQIADGLASSSLSCQSVVVDMLRCLRLEPGQRVLELGTGTGWNAALLARRASPGPVVSVEVDPALADAARERLAGVGAHVQVEVGDGAEGWPPGAPFDRVISTYAVEHVPWAWVRQTRPGGRIVTPWGRLGHVALTVAADGESAAGHVEGLATFMAARGTDPGRDYAAVRGDDDARDERDVERDLSPLREDVRLAFALRVALPEVRVATAVDEDGVNAWLHDGRESWAMLAALGGSRTVAYQGGPRLLWDEVEDAWRWWDAAGRPGVERFGLTVTPDGESVWLDAPARPVAAELAG